MQLIDLSVAIENDLPVDRPGNGPRIRYQHHHETFAALAGPFAGLRPEDLRITEAAEGAIPVELRSVERLGADAFGYGLIEGTDVPMTVRLPGNSAAKRGDRLGVLPEGGRLHLFSTETGKRV